MKANPSPTGRHRKMTVQYAPRRNTIMLISSQRFSIFSWLKTP